MKTKYMPTSTLINSKQCNIKGKTPTIRQSPMQAISDSGKEELVFNRKKPGLNQAQGGAAGDGEKKERKAFKNTRYVCILMEMFSPDQSELEVHWKPTVLFLY